MFLEMQGFDFAQIQSNFPKSNHFCPNFASILLKFCLNFAKSNQICSKKFAKLHPQLLRHWFRV